jgi:sulfopropanediol 3-dehydrogenase
MAVPTTLPGTSRFLKRPEGVADAQGVSTAVAQILAEVRRDGLAGVRAWSERLDRWNPDDFRVDDATIKAAIEGLDPLLRAELDFALGNIRGFAQAQRASVTDLETELQPGVRLGHRLVPIENVGAYVPGGRYPLIASAFMAVATAKVAAVPRVVAVAPPQPDGSGIHRVQLAAIALAGADEVYAIGGVQALGALAHGVEGFGRAVDFLVGAGNLYVTEAKRQLFGTVGIDSLAGPSEVAVIADETADPALVAADLLGQAEHGPTSEVILVTTSRTLAERVLVEIDVQLKTLATAPTAAEAWRAAGALILADSRESAAQIANDIATEHLEIQTGDDEWYFAHVTNYGTVFVGAEATVAYSDKAVGTNHILPTGRAARYTGGLWVGSFLRVLTHQRSTVAGSQATARATIAISEAEGLVGHAETARRRLSTAEVDTSPKEQR